MPSQSQILEAGNSCPICQEELANPVALRMCKVIYCVLQAGSSSCLNIMRNKFLTLPSNSQLRATDKEFTVI